MSPRVLVISDIPKTIATMKFALSLLGAAHDAAASLAEALVRLDGAFRYNAAFLDLRWDPESAMSLASWIRSRLVDRGVRCILGSETPLARRLDAAMQLPSAVFLRRDYDLLDLKEALLPGLRPALVTANG